MIVSVSTIIFVNSCNLISDYAKTIYVDNVVDGDTFHSRNEKYRVLGIDCPETFDPNNGFKPTQGPQFLYGSLAKNVAKKLLDEKYIDVEITKQDKYDRKITKITLSNSDDFALYMVRNGLAIVRYISSNKNSIFYHYDRQYINELKTAQEEARLNKKGFWNESNEIIKKIYPK